MFNKLMFRRIYGFPCNIVKSGFAFRILMIIFGMKSRISRSSLQETLERSCPSCGGNLCLSDLRRWFTLYFIPVIPLNKIESFYKCEGCGNTYKEEIKGMLASNEKNRKQIQEDCQKAFVVTLVACMAQMAKIDGKITQDERDEITKVAEKFPKYRKDVDAAISKVSKEDSEEAVAQMLTKARQVLTVDGIMLLIAQIAKVLLADGRIDRKEEALMKEYMLICGIPKSLYPQILEKVKSWS